MIFEVEKDSLLEGLLKTVPVTEKKSTLPILSHLLMNVADSLLTLTATDLEVGIQMTYDCVVIEPGAITAPAKKLVEIVRELAPGVVRIESTENFRIKITSNAAVFELAGMSADDYPLWIAFTDWPETPLHSTKILRMIEKTLFAASNDDSRFNLNGVLLEETEDQPAKQTRMVATDGHRLALIDQDIDFGIHAKYLIPKKGLHELRRVLESLNEDIFLGFETKNIFMKTERLMMSIRLIDGEYPPYRKVIPAPGDNKVIITKQDLVRALRRIAVFASDLNKGIAINVRPGEMEFSGSHPDLGEARDAIPVEYDGEEFDIFANVFYLLEALHVFDAEHVSLEFHLGGGPIILRPEPPENYFNLVMPMRK